jgi:hypothetical protein
MLKICAALLSLFLLTACEADASDRKKVAGADHPETVETTMRPVLEARWRGTMTITPAAASPGQRIALRFPEAKLRGIAFSLAAWNAEVWEVRYYLISGPGSGDITPVWWAVEDSEGRGWPDVGLAGPGPDYVMIPDAAPRGTYRLCTANARDEACALLTIGR